MSIIFQKLKSLKDRPENEELQGSKPGQSQNIYTFKKVVFSPRGGLIMLATIVGTGLISFYALTLLKTYLDSGSNNAFVVQHQQSDEFADDDIPLEDIPLEDREIMEGEVSIKEPEKLSAFEIEIKNFKIPEYFIHQIKLESEPEPDTDPTQIPDAPDSLPKFLTKKIPSVSLKSIYNPSSKTTTKTFDHLSPTVVTALSEPEVVESTPVGATPVGATPVGTSNITQGNDSNPKPPELTTQKETPKPQDPLTVIKSLKKTNTITPEKKEEAIQDVLRLAKFKRTQATSKIASLAADFEEASLENDTVRADKLIEQLSRLENTNSAYYLKIKAFREIQNKNYIFAKVLLKKVLAKDKDDLDAGMNMAIIEIREEQLSAAKLRLMKLKELYPSQSRIDDLLNLL